MKIIFSTLDVIRAQLESLNDEEIENNEIIREALEGIHTQHQLRQIFPIPSDIAFLEKRYYKTPSKA